MAAQTAAQAVSRNVSSHSFVKAAVEAATATNPVIDT
jgi:hypothetical protein